LKSIESISIIGAGNVATNLALSFYEQGVKIDSIYSQDMNNAAALANQVEAKPVNDTGQLSRESDLYIVALKDDIISRVLKHANLYGRWIAHTSGTYDTDKLITYTDQCSCLYPMQTMTKSERTDFSNVPVFIEAPNEELTAQLSELAGKLSNKVSVLNSEARLGVHVVAVTLNNFVNHLGALGQEFSAENGIDFNVFDSLITKTAEGLKSGVDITTLQTGPAMRGDLKTIDAHLDRLKRNPEYQKLYKTLSKSILNKYHSGEDEL